MAQKGDYNSNPQNILYVGISFGISLAVQIYVFGLLLGRYLDERWGSEPWMLLAGVFLAIFSSFYVLLRGLSALDKAEQRKKEEQKEEEEHCHIWPAF